MNIVLSKTAEELGVQAAHKIVSIIKDAIDKRGVARIVLSTGASQFTTIQALIDSDVDWSKVEMFHLDEYIGIDETHPASFVKYLKERFASKVKLGKVHYVDPSIGVDKIIQKLTKEITKSPIDVGVIGIGVNSHIAFNDPPADFEDERAFKVVELDEACRNQQLNEGWFPTFEDVPTKAITMSVLQILKARHIVSPVPYEVKAFAVKQTLTNDLTNLIPATILKTHPNFTLFLDKDSASSLGIKLL